MMPTASPELSRAALAGHPFGIARNCFRAATNLYSSDFRKAITATKNTFSSTILSVILATAVASAATALIYSTLARRSQRYAQIAAGEISIEADILGSVIDEHAPVVGRTLHYLEAKRDTTQLVVFLHGLGLDANDFRSYMAESKYHCVALTLYGFNESEKKDDRYQPISLQTHVLLLCYAIQKIQANNPRKQVSLVGFSFGADVVLFLSHFASEAARRLKIKTAVLLDSNLNSKTTTISSRIAVLDESRPSELVKILDSAADLTEFRNLCEYLYKITSKNFAQIQQHARDVIELWPGDLYDKFLDRLGQVSIHVPLFA
jgi:pimeloyl-ACP methyl ester carboxylesterase